MLNYKYRNNLSKTSIIGLKKAIWKELTKYETPVIEGTELSVNSIIYHGIKVMKYSTFYKVKMYSSLKEDGPDSLIEIKNPFILKLILDSIKDEFIEVK